MIFSTYAVSIITPKYHYITQHPYLRYNSGVVTVVNPSFDQNRPLEQNHVWCKNCSKKVLKQALY